VYPVVQANFDHSRLDAIPHAAEPEANTQPKVHVHVRQPVPGDGDAWVALIADEIEREYSGTTSRRGWSRSWSVDDIQGYIGVAKEEVFDQMIEKGLNDAVREFSAWLDGTCYEDQPRFRVRQCVHNPARSLPLLSPPAGSPEYGVPPVGTVMAVDLEVTTGDSPPLYAWEADTLLRAGYSISPSWHLIDGPAPFTA
jgi:hypothetical protein